MSSVETNKNKLKSNQIGLFGLMFQGLGGIAPIGIFFALIGAAEFAYGAMALVFIVGLAGALLSANTVYQYSKHIASAKGYYGYVQHGLGKPISAFTSYTYVFYAAANAAGLILFYLFGFSSSINEVFNVNIPWWLGIFYIAIIMVVVAAGMYLGIKPSVKLMIILGLAQIIVLAVISTIFVAKAPDNSFKPFTPYVGASGIFLGFTAIGYLGYSGYGTILSLGEEAKLPRHNIKLAIIGIFILSAFSWIYAAYATTVAWGISDMSSFVSATVPAVILSSKYVGLFGTAVMVLLYDIVAYTLINAFLTSGSRVIFAMGRDNLLHKRFSRVSEKRGSPTMGIATILGITVIMAIITTIVLATKYGLTTGIVDAYIFLGVLTTLAALSVHGITSISLMFSGKSKKLGSINLMKYFTWFIIPAGSIILTLIALYYSLLGIAFPFEAAPIIFVIFWVVLGVYMYVKRETISKEMEDISEYTEVEA